MRRAQILGQALLFVLGAIIFAMILLYGYRSISTLGEMKSQVCVIETQNTLKNQIERVTASVGTVRRMDLTLCPGFETICFVDNRMFQGSSYTDSQIQTGPNTYKTRVDFLAENQSALMADAVRRGSDQNIFLKPASETQIRVGPLTVLENQGFFCIDNIESSTVSLRLEGLGKTTQVGKWQEEQ